MHGLKTDRRRLTKREMSGMLEQLKSLNPNISIYSVESPEFTPYGQVITTLDVTELIQEAKKIEMPETGSVYVPEGSALEVYATTLHFCPCEVENSGFGCVVALPTGTNTPLERESKNPVLFRKNKWLIAHNENEGLISKGVVAGISGENIEIKY